jgi:hypothetical protein
LSDEILRVDEMRFERVQQFLRAAAKVQVRENHLVHELLRNVHVENCAINNI